MKIFLDWDAAVNEMKEVSLNLNLEARVWRGLTKIKNKKIKTV